MVRRENIECIVEMWKYREYERAKTCCPRRTGEVLSVAAKTAAVSAASASMAAAAVAVQLVAVAVKSKPLRLTS